MSTEHDPVLVVGEALVDIVERDGSTSEHVGGSPANVAMGLARLGHHTSLAACIGDDERGAVVARHLADRGVSLAPGTVRPGRTSTALAAIGADGAAEYTFDLDWDPALERLTPASHVHTGSLATVLAPGSAGVVDLLVRLAGGATVSYDPNIRPSVVGDPAALVDGVEQVVRLSDVVKASDEDVALLYPQLSLGDVLERWLALGPALVVVTRGAAGVVWRSTSGAHGSSPTRAERVVDTVGAGDSFMAGLLSGLLDADLLGGPHAAESLRRAGSPALEAAIERGLTTSALTVSHPGAYAPTRSELP